MRKKQWNARIRTELGLAASIVVAATEMTQEEITEAALALLLGSKDARLVEKQKRIEATAKRLRLSFDDADVQPVSLAA